jgi:hypothetical protein
MAKRLTNSEKRARELVEWLIKDFAERLETDGLGREALYGKVSGEIGVSDRQLRNWLTRGSYPRGLYIDGIDNYRLKRVAAEE